MPTPTASKLVVAVLTGSFGVGPGWGKVIGTSHGHNDYFRGDKAWFYVVLLTIEYRQLMAKNQDLHLFVDVGAEPQHHEPSAQSDEGRHSGATTAL